MTTYYAQLGNAFVNYIFRKDLSCTRMADTVRLTDTIVYTKTQLEIVIRLHPDVIPLIYKRSTIDTKHFHNVKITKVPSEHLHRIIQNLKK